MGDDGLREMMQAHRSWYSDSGGGFSVHGEEESSTTYPMFSSYIVNPQPLSAYSSMFPGALYLPSPTTSHPHQPFGNHPQHPPASVSSSANNSLESPLILHDGVAGKYDEKKLSSEGFFGIPEESPDRSFQDLDAENGGLTLRELLGLRYLSQELLDVAVSNNGENPNNHVSTT